MKQEKFIFLANNMKPLSITQDPKGNTIVFLKDTISIIHNYKESYMKLFVGNTNVFKIPDETTLETIYRMHLEHENLYQILHEYAEKNLERITDWKGDV